MPAEGELFFLNFEGRNGKSAILNKLVNLVTQRPIDKSNTVFVFTDANVMFTPETLYELAKHFKNSGIGQVGANILNRGLRRRVLRTTKRVT